MKSGLRKYWKVWLSALVFGLLVLAWFGYRYRAHVLSAFGFISEETGGKMMALVTIVLSLCGLMYLLFCLIFPLIMFFGLRELRRRTVRIEETMQSYGRLIGETNDGSIRLKPEGKLSEKRED